MKANIMMRQFKNFESLPKTATYLGSFEGPHTITEAVLDEIKRAAEPVFFKDEDGCSHYFDLVDWRANT